MKDPDIISSNMKESHQNLEKLKQQEKNSNMIANQTQISNMNTEISVTPPTSSSVSESSSLAANCLDSTSSNNNTDMALNTDTNTTTSRSLSPNSSNSASPPTINSNTSNLLLCAKKELTSKLQNNEFNYINSSRINVLKCNNQIKELHTVLRDKETSHSDFKFYSDRLIRLLVEEGLNELPYSNYNITTHAGCEYNGVKYIKGVCGVSIMRSGEAMEKGLRECCRSIRIGKILIQSTDDESKKSSVVYAKFPNDIISRKILLMYPIITSGTTVNLAINVLKEHGIAEACILLLCLFSTPQGLQYINNQYPDVHILTSEIHPIVPNDFGQRYFGTE